MSSDRPKVTSLWLGLIGGLLLSGPACSGAEAIPLTAQSDVPGADTVPLTDTTDAVLLPSDEGADEMGVDLSEPCALPGAWGCECQIDSECDSEFCAPGPNGNRCAVTCAQGCPLDWSCEDVSEPESPSHELCVPMHAALCRPCQTEADCAEAGDGSAACLEHPDGAGFYCGAHCDEMAPCPTDFECVASSIPGDTSSSQCVPMNEGVCHCNVLASAQGATTTCLLANDHGACSGWRSCGESGLSECDAITPGAEVCDGLDNNCDGETDEGLGLITCGVGACVTTIDACLEGTTPLCEPTPPPAGAEEICNGIDDDCDGSIDEDLGAVSCGIGLCMTSVPGCLQGAPNPCVPLFQPGEIAEACNGMDDDCDGETDEELSDCD